MTLNEEGLLTKGFVMEDIIKVLIFINTIIALFVAFYNLIQ
jgi:hypothetical protein